MSDCDRHGERAQREPQPIARERPGSVQTASTYRRLQRFFQHVRLGQDWALLLLAGVLGQHGSWLLALDRTNWQIGKREVNFLVLATRLTDPRKLGLLMALG